MSRARVWELLRAMEFQATCLVFQYAPVHASQRGLHHNDNLTYKRGFSSWFAVVGQVVSGTIIRAIREVRASRKTRGEPPDFALGCYEGLAIHLNDFVDIFNGEITWCGTTTTA